MLHSVASSLSAHDHSMVQEPVQDGAGGSSVPQRLATIIHGAVGGQEDGSFPVSENEHQEHPPP